MKSYTFDEALKRLNEIGIPTKLYAQAPLGKNIFVIGISDRYKKAERISLWPGRVARAGIATDKRYGQVVLSVFEKGQRVEGRNSLAWGSDNVSLADIKKEWRQHVRTAFPAETRCLKIEEAGRVSAGWGGRTLRRIKYTLRTPTAERCFLLGHDTDGNHVFISMLPTKASSVIDAHNILLPDGVPKGSLRQGEFFFIPAPEFDPGEAIKVERNLGLWTVVGTRKQAKGRGFWGGYQHQISDHTATELAVDWVNGVQYARTSVKNTRHAPLDLAIWHKAVPNNEVPNPRPAGRGGGTSWD